MAYDVSNPPALTAQRVGSGKNSGGAIWSYASIDDLTAVVAADYFSNGEDLGMELGDVVHVFENDAVVTSVAYVKAINAGGAVTVVVVA